MDLEKEFEVERSFREFKRWSQQRQQQIEAIIREAGFDRAQFIEYYRSKKLPADIEGGALADRVAFIRAVVQIDKVLIIDPGPD